ncbi:MAG: ABC transporter permease [Armatimonadetes bacterium]|nr:ABC transporter permease [Armatimonadota bacterium]
MERAIDSQNDVPRTPSPWPSILRAVVLRLFYGILSLIFISFVVFIADELAPGDAANVLAGDKATAAQLESLRHQMGLDRPWPIRYVEFLGNAAKFDFGKSYFGTKRPVGELLAEKLPLTALIALCAIVVASAVGIGLGTIAGIYRTRPPDTAILLASTLGVTIPTFVLAPIMVYYFSTVKDVLPATWDPNPTAPIWMYLLMPVLILAARPAALLTRLTRASMIETLQQEFIRTAIAKGVPFRQLIFRHALRNAILPVITVIGTSFGFLLTGSFVLETVFTIPGIGQDGIEAILQGDMPRVQGIVMVTGAMFVILNLIVDILMPLLDPRIREAQV